MLTRSDSNSSGWTVALAAWYGYLATIGLLIVTGFLVTETFDGVQSFDRAVLDAAADARTGLVVDAMGALSRLTDTWPVVAMLTVTGVLLAWNRWWRSFTFLGVAVGLELSSFVTLSYVVARPRPDNPLGMVPGTNSFPSGHTAMAVVLFVGFGLLTKSLSNDDRVRTWAPRIGAFIAYLVGVSRVYLRLHYVSDVVAGFMLGGLALTVGMVAARIVESRAVTLSPDRAGASSPVTRGRIGVAVGAALVALLLWSVAVEPRHILDVQHEDATIDGLPTDWEGRRFGVIADLQVGMWFDNIEMGRRAVNVLVEEDPDFVLVLGDLVYGEDDTAENIATAVDVMGPLVEAGIPTFAVLGNHDYKVDAASPLGDALEEGGITVLRNEATPVTTGGGREQLWVVGLGPERPDQAEPDAAFADIPDSSPRVVMMHNPTTFERLEPHHAPIAVAGHTHGGQLRVPLLPDWSYLRLVKGEALAVDGWNADLDAAPGNRLFVNRGIGMSVFPARLNASPAITLFTLRSS